LIIHRRALFWPVALAGLIGTAPSPAAESLQPLLACRAVVDSSARLACFDRESASLATGSPGAPTGVLRTAPAGAAPGTPSIESATAPKANFGLTDEQVSKKEEAAGKRPAGVKEIEAHITAISSTGTGYATFTLDNGQVWREISPEGDLLAKTGDAVTVSRGILSSYWLQTRNGRGAKVHRVL
jgi:hypothetical protein